MKDQINTATEILILSHAHSDLLCHRRLSEILPADFPITVAVDLQGRENDVRYWQDLSHHLKSAKIVIVRALGDSGSIAGLSEILAAGEKTGAALLMLSGTGEPNADLACLSTVSSEILEATRHYFACGGVANLKECLTFLADSLLFTSFGYEAPRTLPDHGFYHGSKDCLKLLTDFKTENYRGVVAILFYRAHWLSGNLKFVDAIISALEEHGLCAIGIYTASLRCLNEEGKALALAQLDDYGITIDTIINTTSFSSSEYGETPQSVLQENSAPVLQAICSTMTMEQWKNSSRGLSPLDTAMNVVLPEFDGRIITHPVCFRGQDGESAALYESPADRVDRLAKLTARIVRLRKLPNQEKKVAFVLTNSSSKASQIGNAVGLDSPASLIVLLKEMQAQGYAFKKVPDDGDKLIHDLIALCSYDEQFLTEEQTRQCLGKVTRHDYLEFFRTLPEALQKSMVE
ncbi:MAG TPA: cobaltochelatase subunit CobN, partial [Candidatus Obscuribacter sp.]|nr:cobaltochelatase subunit CobN [Candidatus Obscuribacter sp.]